MGTWTLRATPLPAHQISPNSGLVSGFGGCSLGEASTRLCDYEVCGSSCFSNLAKDVRLRSYILEGPQNPILKYITQAMIPIRNWNHGLGFVLQLWFPNTENLDTPYPGTLDPWGVRLMMSWNRSKDSFRVR